MTGTGDDGARRRTLAVVVGLFGTAALWLGGIAFHHKSIENNLGKRATAVLAADQARRFGGLTVGMSGRDATLTGLLPAAPDRSDAHHLARTLIGMRHVTDNFTTSTSTPPPPTPPPTKPTVPVTTGTTSTTSTTVAAPTTGTTPTPTTAPTIALPDPVHFATDESALDDDALFIISEVVTIMTGNPTIRVDVAGHADERRDEQYNLDLSARRANAVTQALIARGVDPNRLTTSYYGKSRPASQTDNALNRRVEFTLLP